MTIQEFIRVAINKYPSATYDYYRPYFLNMDCGWCMYNGHACRHPEGDDVCMEYRVEKKHLENQV